MIKDEKNVVLDTVDKRATEDWMENLSKALNGENVDYLIVSHMEPDHAYNIGLLCNKHPNMKIVGNEKTFTFIEQFFNIEDLDSRKIVVKEGNILNFGEHSLQFLWLQWYIGQR